MYFWNGHFSMLAGQKKSKLFNTNNHTCTCQQATPVSVLVQLVLFTFSEMMRRLITERDDLVEKLDMLKETLKVSFAGPFGYLLPPSLV